MKKIFFNADDLGLTKGVNEGILTCYKQGIVNSCSFLTNTKYFDETVLLIKNNGIINVGLHFNLSEGHPLLPTHKTIVDNNGTFFRNICERDTIDYSEIQMELEAQLNRALSNNIEITHLDSHHHIHMSAKLQKAFLAISKKYSLPIRKIDNVSRNPFKKLKNHFFYKRYNFYTAAFSPAFYDSKVSIKTLEEIIKNSKGDSLEIMCHPGYIDSENGIYNLQRKTELDILTSSTIKDLVKNKIVY